MAHERHAIPHRLVGPNGEALPIRYARETDAYVYVLIVSGDAGVSPWALQREDGGVVVPADALLDEARAWWERSRAEKEQRFAQPGRRSDGAPGTEPASRRARPGARAPGRP